jgi:hypothetical protein
VQSIAGVLESTMILAVLDTLPEGRTRANRRGYMVEILTIRVRTKANSVSELKNGKRKILETADLSNRLGQQKFCSDSTAKGFTNPF